MTPSHMYLRPDIYDADSVLDAVGCVLLKDGQQGKKAQPGEIRQRSDGPYIRITDEQARVEGLEKDPFMPVEEFKKKYGKKEETKTKVVGKDGKPLTLYHGSPQKVERFKPYTHFGTREAATETTDPKHLHPVQLDIRNPLRLTDYGGREEHQNLDWLGEAEQKGAITENEAESIRRKFTEGSEDDKQPLPGLGEALFRLLESKGYDGIVYENAREDAGEDSWVIFSPNQVRTAEEEKPKAAPGEEQDFRKIKDEAVKKRVSEAFAALASSQRGEPEALATSSRSPLVRYGTGMFQDTAEHVGDLTHRMSQTYAESLGMGREWVGEKVRKLLRRLRNPYGFGREIREQTESTYEYYSRPGNWNEEKYGPLPKDKHEWSDKLREAGKAYADAHSKLTVYNPAQWHAREAAVAFGKMDYLMMERHLKALEEMLGSGKWEEHAAQVQLDGEGNPVPYRSIPAEPVSKDIMLAVEFVLENDWNFLIEKGLFWRRKDGTLWTHKDPYNIQSKIVPYNPKSHTGRKEASPKKIAALLKKYPDLTQEEVGAAILVSGMATGTKDTPHTSTAEYVPWLAKQMALAKKSNEEREGDKGGGLVFPEDAAQAQGILGTFHRLKRSKKFRGEKDINRYKSFRELERAVGGALEAGEQSKKEAAKDINIEGAELLDEKEGKQLVKLTSFDAVKGLCGSSKWCVLQQGYYDEYAKNGPLFLFRLPNGARILYSEKSPYGGGPQLMDVEDDFVGAVPKDFAQMFEDNGLALPKGVDVIEDVDNIDDPHTATEYAVNYLRERVPSLEPVIKQDPRSVRTYVEELVLRPGEKGAKYIAQERLEELENLDYFAFSNNDDVEVITREDALSDPAKAADYMISTGTSDEALTKTLLKGDSDTILGYVSRAKKRLPAFENRLLKKNAGRTAARYVDALGRDIPQLTDTIHNLAASPLPNAGKLLGKYVSKFGSSPNPRRVVVRALRAIGDADDFADALAIERNLNKYFYEVRYASGRDKEWKQQAEETERRVHARAFDYLYHRGEHREEAAKVDEQLKQGKKPTLETNKDDPEFPPNRRAYPGRFMDLFGNLEDRVGTETYKVKPASVSHALDLFDLVLGADGRKDYRGVMRSIKRVKRRFEDAEPERELKPKDADVVRQYAEALENHPTLTSRQEIARQIAISATQGKNGRVRELLPKLQKACAKRAREIEQLGRDRKVRKAIERHKRDKKKRNKKEASFESDVITALDALFEKALRWKRKDGKWYTHKDPSDITTPIIEWNPTTHSKVKAVEDKLQKLSKQFPSLSETDFETAMHVSLAATAGELGSDGNLQFVPWIASQMHRAKRQEAKGQPITGLRFPDDVEQTLQTLHEFALLKNSPNFTGSKNISDYKGLPALTETVDAALGRDEMSAAAQKRAVDEAQTIAGTKVVAKVGDYKLTNLENPTACETALRGTKWCVRDRRAAERYLEDGPLLLLTEGNRRIGLYHYNKEADRIEFNDLDNRPFYYISEEMADLINSQGLDIPQSTTVMTEEEAMKTPGNAETYLTRVLQRRDPKFEAKVQESPELAKQYAMGHVIPPRMRKGLSSGSVKYVAKPLYDELVPFLGEEPPLFDYITLISKEDALKSPAFAFEYLMTLGKRDADVEATLAKDANESVRYVVESGVFSRGDRFEAGEPAIARDPKTALQYAMHLGKRFKRGEEALATDPGASVSYARLIDGRFERGEETIASDSAATRSYAEFLGERFKPGEKSLRGGDAALYALRHRVRLPESEDSLAALTQGDRFDAVAIRHAVDYAQHFGVRLPKLEEGLRRVATEMATYEIMDAAAIYHTRVHPIEGVGRSREGANPMAPTSAMRYMEMLHDWKQDTEGKTDEEVWGEIATPELRAVIAKSPEMSGLLSSKLGKTLPEYAESFLNRVEENRTKRGKIPKRLGDELAAFLDGTTSWGQRHPELEDVIVDMAAGALQDDRAEYIVGRYVDSSLRGRPFPKLEEGFAQALEDFEDELTDLQEDEKDDPETYGLDDYEMLRDRAERVAKNIRTYLSFVSVSEIPEDEVKDYKRRLRNMEMGALLDDLNDIIEDREKKEREGERASAKKSLEESILLGVDALLDKQQMTLPGFPKYRPPTPEGYKPPKPYDPNYDPETGGYRIGTKREWAVGWRIKTEQGWFPYDPKKNRMQRPDGKWVKVQGQKRRPTGMGSFEDWEKTYRGILGVLHSKDFDRREEQAENILESLYPRVKKLVKKIQERLPTKRRIVNVEGDLADVAREMKIGENGIALNKLAIFIDKKLLPKIKQVDARRSLGSFYKPSRAAERKLSEVEQRVQELEDHEECAVVDQRGNITFAKAGTSAQDVYGAGHYIRFTEEEVASMSGGAFTHNHPSDTSFSLHDIALFLSTGLQEIRARGFGRTFRMAKRKGGFPREAYEDAVLHLKDVDSSVRVQFRAALASGDMTVEEADANHHRVVAARFVQLYSDLLEYEEIAG